MSDLNNDFSERLTQLMDEYEVSGRELATFLNHSEATVSNWKTGKYLPDVYTLVEIAAYFHKSVDWFLGIPQAAMSRQYEHKGIVWEVNIPENLVGRNRTEFELGVALFHALVYENLDLDEVRKLPEFKDYGIETLYGFLKMVLSAKALRILAVPRNHELEALLVERYPNLQSHSVIVADIQDKNDGTLIRAEFVSFLAASLVLDKIQYPDQIGIGAGYTMYRMVEQATPSLDRFRGTRWVPLISFRDKVINQYRANFICELLSNKFSQSRHYNYNFLAEQNTDDIFIAHENLRTAFISMNGLGRSSRSHQTAALTGELRTADFGEFGRLRNAYQRLMTDEIYQRMGGTFLGYVFDRQGQPICAIMDEVANEVQQISLPRWKTINARGHVWVVGARLYKALPIMIAIQSGLANSLVIDNEIAEFILEMTP